MVRMRSCLRGGSSPALFAFFLLAMMTMTVTVTVAMAKEARVEITDYPEEISLEKGWTKYVTFQVNNTGIDTALHSVTFDIEGLPQGWTDFQTKKVDVIEPGAAAAFVVRFAAPADARTQRYAIRMTAAADEASDEKIASVSVFGSRPEVLLQEIQSLKTKLNYLDELANIAERTGKNATTVRDKLERASEILQVADSYLYQKKYDEDLELLRGASKLLELAESEMDGLPAATSRPIVVLPGTGGYGGVQTTFLVVIVVIAALVGGTVAFFTFKSIQRFSASGGRADYIQDIKSSLGRELAPAMAIKEQLPPQAEERLETRSRLERMMSMLESDYRQGRLSKEAYLELKLKYEGKLAVFGGSGKGVIKT